MYDEQQGLIHAPQAVESESATTNHEENRTGAFPVVLSLGIVALLALIAFALTSFIAGAMQGPLYAALREQYLGNSGSSLMWDYDDYGYDDWYYDDWGYDDWYFDDGDRGGWGYFDSLAEARASLSPTQVP